MDRIPLGTDNPLVWTLQHDPTNSGTYVAVNATSTVVPADSQFILKLCQATVTGANVSLDSDTDAVFAFDAGTSKLTVRPAKLWATAGVQPNEYEPVLTVYDGTLTNGIAYTLPTIEVTEACDV